MSEMRELDPERQRTSFGAFAAPYESARPEWPAATAGWLVGADEGGPLAGPARQHGLRVADVGAGTGKLTRTLVAHGHEVVAVDPSEGMLQTLRRVVPGTPTFVGRAEQLPLPDVAVDAVTVAQAWHWVMPDEASAEIARVLRPGGVLGIGWHVRDESVPWVLELSMLTRGRPDYADARAELPRAPWFVPAGRTTFRYDQRLTVEELVTLSSSWSYVALRPDRDEVLARVRELGERVLAEHGSVVVPHETRCWRYVRAEV